MTLWCRKNRINGWEDPFISINGTALSRRIRCEKRIDGLALRVGVQDDDGEIESILLPLLGDHSVRREPGSGIQIKPY